MIGSELVLGTSAAKAIKGEWRELVENSDDATPFQTWEWQDLWLKHYGQGKTSLVLAIREGKDLIGLAPFVRSNGLWRALRWAGGGPSDYLQPIARAGNEAAVAEKVWEFIKDFGGADLVDLHQVRETQPLASLITATDRSPKGAHQIEQATCLLLDLPSSYETYLKTLGKSLRYDVRKLEKELFASGRATMELADPDSVGPGFEIFLEQHKARWRKRNLPGAFIGRSLRFHREWVTEASRQGWLRLKILRHEGTPIGSIYAMQFKRTLYYYQAGFDPEFKALSPGTLLVADSIRAGIEEGATHFDFMRGAEAYKRRWKPQHVHHNLRLQFAQDSLRGGAGLKWNATANQVEMKLRAKLEGGNG